MLALTSLLSVRAGQERGAAKRDVLWEWGAGKVPGIFYIGYILDQGDGGRGALYSPPTHPDLGIARAPMHLELQHFVSKGRGCPKGRKPDTSSPGWASTVGLMEWGQNTCPCLGQLKTPSQGSQVERALTSSQENPGSSPISLELAV